MNADVWAVVNKKTGAVIPIDGAAAFYTAQDALDAIKKAKGDPVSYPRAADTAFDVAPVSLIRR